MPGDGKYISGDELYKKVAANTPGLTPEKFKADMSNPKNQYSLFSNLRDANDKSTPSDYGEFRKQYGFDKLSQPSKTQSPSQSLINPANQPKGQEGIGYGNDQEMAEQGRQMIADHEKKQKDLLNGALLKTGMFKVDNGSFGLQGRSGGDVGIMARDNKPFNIGGNLVSTDPTKTVEEQKQQAADNYYEGGMSDEQKKVLPYVKAYFNTDIPYEQKKYADLIKASVPNWKAMPKAQYLQFQHGIVSNYLQDILESSDRDNKVRSVFDKVGKEELTPEDKEIVNKDSQSNKDYETNLLRNKTAFTDLAYMGNDVQGEPGMIQRFKDNITKGVLDFVTGGNYSMATTDEWNKRAANIYQKNGIAPQDKGQVEAFNPTTSDAIQNGVENGLSFILPMIVGGWVGDMAKLPELTTALSSSKSGIVNIIGKLVGKAFQGMPALQMSNWHESMKDVAGQSAAFAAIDMIPYKPANLLGRIIVGAAKGVAANAAISEAMPLIKASYDAIKNDEDFQEKFKEYSPDAQDFLINSVQMGIFGAIGGLHYDPETAKTAIKEVKEKDPELAKEAENIQNNGQKNAPGVQQTVTDFSKQQGNPIKPPQDGHYEPITMNEGIEKVKHPEQKHTDIKAGKLGTNKAMTQDFEYGTNEDDNILTKQEENEFKKKAQSHKDKNGNHDLVVKSVEVNNPKGGKFTRLIVVDKNHDYLGHEIFNLTNKEVTQGLDANDYHKLAGLIGGDVNDNLDHYIKQIKSESGKAELQKIKATIADKTASTGAKNDVKGLLFDANKAQSDGKLHESRQFMQQAEVKAKMYGYKTNWENGQLKVQTPEGEEVVGEKTLTNEDAQKLSTAVQNGDVENSKTLANNAGLNVITEQKTETPELPSKIDNKPKENVVVKDGDKILSQTEYNTIDKEPEPHNIKTLANNIAKTDNIVLYDETGARMSKQEISKGTKDMNEGVPSLAHQRVLNAVKQAITEDKVIDDKNPNAESVKSFNERANAIPENPKSIKNTAPESPKISNNKEEIPLNNLQHITPTEPTEEVKTTKYPVRDLESKEMSPEQITDRDEFLKSKGTDLAKYEKIKETVKGRNLNTEWQKLQTEKYAEKENPLPDKNAIEEPKEETVPTQKKGETEHEISDDIKEKKISDLNVKTDKTFQNRDELFDETHVKNLQKQIPNTKSQNEPIVTWIDKEGKIGDKGKEYVISGHNRYEAMKRNGIENIKTREYLGSLEKAKQFATESANQRLNESNIERAKIYRKLRKQIAEETEPSKKKELKTKLSEGLESEEKNQKEIEAYSYLNDKGKAINALKNIKVAGGESTKEIEKRSNWIGKARQDFPELSDTHEDELFDYLISGDGKNIDSYAELKPKINKAIEIKKQKDFADKGTNELNPDEKIDMAKSGQKDTYEQEFEHKIAPFKEAYDQAREDLKNKYKELGINTDTFGKPKQALTPEEAETIKPLANKVTDTLQELNKQKGTYGETAAARASQQDLFAAGITGDKKIKEALQKVSKEVKGALNSLGINTTHNVESLPERSIPYAKAVNNIRGHFSDIYNKNLSLENTKAQLLDVAKKYIGKGETEAQKEEYETTASTLQNMAKFIGDKKDLENIKRIVEGNNKIKIAGKEYYANNLSEIEKMKDFKRPKPPMTRQEIQDIKNFIYSRLDHISDALEGKSERQITKGAIGLFKQANRVAFFMTHIHTTAPEEIRNEVFRTLRDTRDFLTKQNHSDNWKNAQTHNEIAEQFGNNKKVYDALISGVHESKEWTPSELTEKGLSREEKIGYYKVRNWLKESGYNKYTEAYKYYDKYADMSDAQKKEYDIKNNNYLEQNNGHLPLQRNQGQWQINAFGKNPDTGIEGRYYSRFKNQEDAQKELERLKKEGYTGIDDSGNKAAKEKPTVKSVAPKDELASPYLHTLNDFEQALAAAHIDKGDRDKITDIMQNKELNLTDDEHKLIGKIIGQSKELEPLLPAIEQNINRFKKNYQNPHFLNRSLDVNGNIVHGYPNDMKGILDNIFDFNERAAHNKAKAGAMDVLDRAQFEGNRYRHIRNDLKELHGQIKEGLASLNGMQHFQNAVYYGMLGYKAKQVVLNLLHTQLTVMPEAGNEIDKVHIFRKQNNLPAYRNNAYWEGSKDINMARKIAHSIIMGNPLPDMPQSLKDVIQHIGGTGGMQHAFTDYITGKEVAPKNMGSWRWKAASTGFTDLVTRAHAAVMAHHIGEEGFNLKGDELNKYAANFVDRTKFEWDKYNAPKVYKAARSKNPILNVMLAPVRSVLMMKSFHLQDLGYNWDYMQRAENKGAALARLAIPRLVIGGGLTTSLAALGGVAAPGLLGLYNALHGRKDDAEERRIFGNSFMNTMDYGVGGNMLGVDMSKMIDAGQYVSDMPLTDQIGGTGASFVQSMGKSTYGLLHGDYRGAIKNLPIGSVQQIRRAIDYYRHYSAQIPQYTGSGSQIMVRKRDIAAGFMGVTPINWENYYKTQQFKDDMVGQGGGLEFPAQPTGGKAKDISDMIQGEITNEKLNTNTTKINNYLDNPNDSTFIAAFGKVIHSNIGSYNKDLYNDYQTALGSMAAKDFPESFDILGQVSKYELNVDYDKDKNNYIYETVKSRMK